MTKAWGERGERGCHTCPVHSWLLSFGPREARPLIMATSTFLERSGLCGGEASLRDADKDSNSSTASQAWPTPPSVLPYSPHGDPIFSLYFTGEGNQGSERLGHLPKVTQLSPGLTLPRAFAPALSMPQGPSLCSGWDALLLICLALDCPLHSKAFPDPLL